MGGDTADWESGADKMPSQGFIPGISSFLGASIVGTRGGSFIRGFLRNFRMTKRQQKDRLNGGPLWALGKLDWKTGLGSETRIIFHRKGADLSLRGEQETAGG